MGEKERSALTEPMFYILTSFLKQERCGTEIADHSRVPVGMIVNTGIYGRSKEA